MNRLKTFKYMTLGFMAATMAGSGSYGDDTSRSANTRLPTDHEENIRNAQLKRYRKACKKGYVGTVEDFFKSMR